ncbi:MAG: hypothetical protein H7X80_08035, partial [bacterium]|nr:hypothetical protein [Candidatus Kapabacteria bacterium]
MGRLYTLAIVMAISILAVQNAVAQQSHILVLPDTPCDSIACGSLIIDGGRTSATVRVEQYLRDGNS